MKTVRHAVQELTEWYPSDPLPFLVGHNQQLYAIWLMSRGCVERT